MADHADNLAALVSINDETILMARRLGELTYRLCAAPSYLQRYGSPESIDALRAHRRVVFAPRGRPNWRLSDGDSTVDLVDEPAMNVNNQLLARRLVLDGHGIGLVPDHQIHDDLDKDRLRSVLPGWTRDPVPVNALFTKTRYMTPKVRTFIDLCVERFDDVHLGGSCELDVSS